MENKLARLFDYQKYEPNDKLSSIIKDVESRYPDDIKAMSDDELSMLSAAGIIVGSRTKKGHPLTSFPDE